ncbi:unnamed protein product [Rhizophagus irregularis]|nr:unnamed protein product [Rhizophagus irregularis]
MLEKLIVVTSFKLRRTPVGQRSQPPPNFSSRSNSDNTLLVSRCVQETLKEIIGIIFEILITNKLDNHLSLRLKILLLWVVIPVCGKSPVIILVLKIKLLDKSTKIKR